MHPPLNSPPIQAAASRWAEFPVLLSRYLLVVHSKYSSVYMSIPNSHLSRPPILPPAAAAKSLQSCPTLCDPIDSSPPGSPVPDILQARTLEWVAISFSNAWMWNVKVKSLSRVWLLATPWTADHQAPPSMGFSRQEYWSGSPLPSLILPPSNHKFVLWVSFLFCK